MAEYSEDDSEELESDGVDYELLNAEVEIPEGVFSLLDTDLYKLTMQCAIYQTLPDVGEYERT